MSVRQSIGPWKPDMSVSVCDRCQQPFSVVRRRHHCRCCGCIFCYNCCNYRAVLPELDPIEPQRVCTDCKGMLRQRPPPQQRSPPSHAQERESNRVRGCTNPTQAPAAERSNSAECTGHRKAATPALQDVCDRDESEETDTSSEADADSFDDSDDGSIDVNVSSAVAGVLSSWDERKTNSLSFLPALQGNLVASDAPNVLNVLLFPNERCYCVNVVTVGEAETMQQLADRMAEHFFKLANGPFVPFDEAERSALRKSLHFSTETNQLTMSSMGIEVAALHRHIVLSTLSPEELRARSDRLTGSAVSSLRDFFNSEGTAHNGDESLVE